jgi:hypothetical protein
VVVQIDESLFRHKPKVTNHLKLHIHISTSSFLRVIVGGLLVLSSGVLAW